MQFEEVIGQQDAKQQHHRGTRTPRHALLWSCGLRQDGTCTCVCIRTIRTQPTVTPMGASRPTLLLPHHKEAQHGG